MSGSIVPIFLGALQASLAVLLTISYGVIASRFSILKASSAKDVSKLCVRLFLPALLITNVGSQLNPDTALRYVPVLIWSLVYTLSSMALGWALKRAFKFPPWTVAAICFNNTTALPLLLLQALETAGILKDLAMDENDSSSAVLQRAKSYLLTSAMVANCLTFAVGPKLLDDEESPDQESASKPREIVHDSMGRTPEEEEEYENPRNADGRTAAEEEEYENETTTLLPNSASREISKVYTNASEESNKLWAKLPILIQEALSFLGAFLNGPLIGAAIGGIIGLTPALQTAFFNPPEDGGLFTAWLTASVKNTGELFASLQLVVVGAKLSSSLMKMKKGETSGSVPLVAMFAIFSIRFILWPVASISIIYLIAAKTNWLAQDPVLWFVLMLMPTGPPATKLTALADVSNASEDEKMSIAKFLAISYAISPVICLAVVGSLKAAMAVTS